MHTENSQRQRRQFLLGTVASVAMASVGFPRKTTLAATMNNASTDDGHRILELRLQTASPLDTMRDYYRDTLGLPVLDQTESELAIQGGRTKITFIKTKQPDPPPFYHFAFNIPENKVKTAHDWQAERGPLMPTPKLMQDRNFPPAVRHFRNWNAHSVFFWDPAGNILEYIGRHTLDNAADGPFTSDDILYASEIAFITDDVATMADTIEKHFDLPQYLQGNDAFHAIGDEHGLLLVFERGRTSGAAVKNPQRFDVFTADVKIRSDKSLDLPDAPYRINHSA